MDVAPQYLSLRQLSTYASLSVKTLKGYLVDREHPLPHYKVTGKILVDLDEFKTWIEHYRRRRQPVNLDRLVDDVLSAVQSERGIVV